jgi:hypothetical protein
MPASTDRVTFRLPRTAYLVVLFLFVGVIPFALSGGTSSDHPGSAELGPLVLLFLIPVAAAFFISRTATVVDADGITVRALLGSRRMPWAQLRGINVDGATVYAVPDDGRVRLPCVQVRHLTVLAQASGDHLPALSQPVYKQPPVRQRRR